jgi:hypothetical protein
MLVVPKVSALLLLNAIQNALLGLISVHLYVNDISPDLDTVLADLTEASFPGYAGQVGTFTTPPFTNGSNKAETDQDSSVTFTSTGSSGETAYGYYITDTLNADLYWIERFASPVPFDQAGRFVTIGPQLTLVSEFTG